MAVSSRRRIGKRCLLMCEWFGGAKIRFFRTKTQVRFFEE
jgi:hypothetical protein